MSSSQIVGGKGDIVRVVTDAKMFEPLTYYMTALIRAQPSGAGRMPSMPLAGIHGNRP
jgi:hypothetical protein